MLNEIVKAHSPEFRKGCPACEHTDPELERELQGFAQLLFDIYLANRSAAPQSGADAEEDIDFIR